MTVALTSNHDFKSKLTSILDTAKAKKEQHVVILTDVAWHEEIQEALKNIKSVGSIKMGGQTFFIIKEMRLEVKPIDFYL
jgi:hypothetical protein